MKRMAFAATATVLVLLVTAITIELTLRLVGWAASAAQARANPEVSFAPEEFRILALGESTTAQFWSNGREEAWPGQLQKKLNAADLGRKFVVLNLAVGGTSTPLLLRDLEANIEKYHPQMIISMMGINDLINYEFLHRSGWRSLRIVKLVRWMYHAWNTNPVADLPPDEIDGINAKVEKMLGPSPQNHLDEIERSVGKLAKSHAIGQWKIYQLATAKTFNASSDIHSTATAQEKARIVDLARKLIVKSYDLNPTDLLTLRFLVYTSQYDPLRLSDTRARIISALRQGVEIDGPLATLMAGGALGEPTEEFQRALEESGGEQKDGRSYYEITLDSYHQLADMAHAHHVVYAAMQYPTANVDGLRNFFVEKPQREFVNFGKSLYAQFPSIELSPQYRDIIFISNQNFDSVVTSQNRGEYFTDMFTAGVFDGRFGHTTTKGHALIAQNAFSAILANWATIQNLSLPHATERRAERHIRKSSGS